MLLSRAEADCCSSNMLYPKEDRENNQLMYACRTCTFSEPAVTACVYRNQLVNTVGESAGVTQDVGADPTVCDLFFDASDPSTRTLPPKAPSGLADVERAALELGLPMCMLCGQEIVYSADDEHDLAEPVEEATTLSDSSIFEELDTPDTEHFELDDGQIPDLDVIDCYRSLAVEEECLLWQ